MGKLLEGKLGLICNVANERSAAWAMAKSADAHGARLALGYLGEREKVRVDKLVPQLATPPLLFNCDVTDEALMAEMAEGLKAEFGRVDFLGHALAFAKIEDLKGRFIDGSRDGFSLAHDVSVYSLSSLARLVEPLMTEGGSVVTLSYIGALRAVPNYNVMGVAKAALEASVRYLAADLGPSGIRVNAISAGPMRTLASAAIGDFGSMYRAYAERVPLRRNTTQDEVADASVFLFSDLARGITGDVLYVDGGYHILGV
ncbi:MAG TPA: NADH-specific enoyl-ACP reductase [Armatimonadetes bacterium]|nr:NADH-specific enoyl-ACP reductase [Armatimonadota bacterium]